MCSPGPVSVGEMLRLNGVTAEWERKSRWTSSSAVPVSVPKSHVLAGPGVSRRDASSEWRDGGMGKKESMDVFFGSTRIRTQIEAGLPVHRARHGSSLS
jgi:hypothetical protein